MGMCILMTTIPVTTAVNKDEFYYIRFSPTAIEWRYLVHKILDAVEIRAWNDYIINTHEDNGDWVYMLKKERYPAKLIADHLGTTEANVTSNLVLVLDDIAQNKDLPKPTVGYWGTA